MSITLRAKRILTGALAGALVLGLLPAGVASANLLVCEGAGSAGFADTDTTHQANIDCAVAYGIVSGQAGNVFNASGNMTRGQMATALVNFVATAKNVDVSALPTGTNTFEDVAGTTHEANIARAFAMGIIQGRSATVFDPGSRITRGAAATMIANAHVSADALGMDLSGVTPATNFTDLGDSVHAGNINVLAAAGVITGTSATTFSPNRAVTRGQTVTLLVGAANLVVAPNGLWNAPTLSTPVIAGNVVTERTGNVTSFKYSTGSEIVSVTVGENDVFIIDGFTGTAGTFDTDLSVGDVVVVEKDTPATGRQTIRLTNRTAAAYTTGITGGLNVDNITIIEPVSGVVLRGGGDVTGDAVIDITKPLSTYTVDGTSGTLAQFRDNINTGDIIAISGAGTTANPYVFALTNRTVTGKATTLTDTDTGVLTVKSSAGFSVDSTAIGANDVITIDGVTVTGTAANRKTALDTHFTVPVADGRKNDVVTYSRAGGVQTITVVSQAAAAVSGTVGPELTGIRNNRLSYVAETGAARRSTETLSAYNLFVGNTAVSEALFRSQLTVGDAVVVQEKDGKVNAKGSIRLTNQPLAGKVNKVVRQDPTNNDNISVDLQTGTSPVTTDRIDTTRNNRPFGSTEASTFTVNGTSRTQAQFATQIGLIGEGTNTGTIVISQVGNATNYALTVTPAAAATFTVQNPGKLATTTVRLAFDRPVRYVAALAAGDFVVTNGGTAVAVTGVSPFSPADHNSTLTLTFASFTPSGTVSVQLTEQGAAKVLDKNGNAAAAATKTVAAAAQFTLTADQTVAGNPDTATLTFAAGSALGYPGGGDVLVSGDFVVTVDEAATTPSDFRVLSTSIIVSLPDTTLSGGETVVVTLLQSGADKLRMGGEPLVIPGTATAIAVALNP